jgi:hypothetical protein
MICRYCGEEFLPTNKRGPKPSFCSDLCAGRSFRAGLRANRVTIHVDEYIKCGVCCIVFSRRKTRGAKPKYCSEKCRRIADNSSYKKVETRKEAEPKEKNCVNCGELFVDASRALNRKYCGECVFTRDCLGCGVEMILDPMLKNHREKKVCSKGCGNTLRKIYTDKQARWRASSHKRRVKIRGAEYERFDIIKVFERDSWRCHICGVKTLKSKRGTRHPKAPELDHIVTLKEGGHHKISNVACACCKCNNTKGSTSHGQMNLGFFM